MPNGYDLISPGCVNGADIEMFSLVSVESCAALCDADTDCLAFEYGVDHGGSSDAYQPGDCQLQSASDSGGCDGAYHNLDLYVKVAPVSMMCMISRMCSWCSGRLYMMYSTAWSWGQV